MKVFQSNITPGEQVQMLKMQQIMMPAMILFMGFAAPSGLVLYWITGNLFTMTQTIVLRKIMEREELQLQKLRKTPLGMSGVFVKSLRKC